MVGVQEPGRSTAFARGKNSCKNLKTNSQTALARDLLLVLGGKGTPLLWSKQNHILILE